MITSIESVLLGRAQRRAQRVLIETWRLSLLCGGLWVLVFPSHHKSELEYCSIHGEAAFDDATNADSLGLHMAVHIRRRSSQVVVGHHWSN